MGKRSFFALFAFFASPCFLQKQKVDLLWRSDGLFQDGALDQPVAAGQSDEYGAGGNVTNDESWLPAKFPDQRQDERGDGDLADLDAEVEREQRRDRFDAGADAEFAERRSETEAVDEAEGEGQQPASFDLAAENVFQSDVNDR